MRLEKEKCKCGEPLITYDEQKRQACWRCAGMAQHLNVLDKELDMLAWEARKPWEPAPRLLRSA